MSKDMQKKVERDTVIYENSEARWVFSQGRPPHIDDYQVAITAVDKHFNIPVMMIMSSNEFRKLIIDLGIKVHFP